MKRKLVPDIIQGQTVHTVAPDLPAVEAARKMSEHRIAALAVMENARLVGILTERDITARLVALGKDPATTPVGQVMTESPDTLPPDALATEALNIMRQRGYRHIPVMDGETVVAMLSIRDLNIVIQEALERELAERDAYIFGDAQ
ncbi:CBS domain-containing protein [Roseospirillum parvum]|uniref:CBS domain-containing protein n=1 Tax=Roseospirillum parvum TaxID=83401 RepID=A0A1G8D6E1_9PROT|nr:CBS domain-containing protein [Roseospirillum parvum]SDH53286.1 CBS domain-containing protein [Roseospirillum parvum]